jgi:hypothetical protein
MLGYEARDTNGVDPDINLYYLMGLMKGGDNNGLISDYLKIFHEKKLKEIIKQARAGEMEDSWLWK